MKLSEDLGRKKPVEVEALQLFQTDFNFAFLEKQKQQQRSFYQKHNKINDEFKML